MCVAVRAHVREMPARDLNLVRDSVQSQERAERRRVELGRIFPFRKDLVAGAEFSDVMIPNVLQIHGLLVGSKTDKKLLQ
jgi:hypothetical protein